MKTHGFDQIVEGVYCGKGGKVWRRLAHGLELWNEITIMIRQKGYIYGRYGTYIIRDAFGLGNHQRFCH